MSNMSLSDPGHGVASELLPHVHLLSTFRYTQKARVEIPEVTNWLMNAPQIARDKAPFFWTYLDRPENGYITLTWQPLQLMGTNFASDGYIWPPQEQYFTQEVGNGVVLEMYYHRAGYALGEPIATHSRRRFRLIPPSVHNPNAPQVDPSLWIVHYGPIDNNERIPVQMLPRDPRTDNMLQTRAYLQRCGQIQRKEFILGDRVNWPQIAWPREPARQPVYAGNRGGVPAANQPPAAIGVLPTSEGYDDDEDTSRGDMFDHLTPREISLVRYRQNHEWMEEILSSPYRMGQIGFTNLGLGMKGELSSLTDGIFEAQGADAAEHHPVKAAGHLDPKLAEEFRKRVDERIASTNDEIAKLKAEHEKKMAKFKKNSLLTTAEKELRYAVDDAGPGAIALETRPEEPEEGSGRWTSKQNKSVDDIVSQVEAQLGRHAEVIYDLRRIQDGGYQEPAPEPAEPSPVPQPAPTAGATGSNAMSRQGSQQSNIMLGGDSDVDMGGTAASMLDQMHTGISSTSTPANNFSTPQGQLSAMPSNAATPANANVPSPMPTVPEAPKQEPSGDVSMSGTDEHPSAATAPDQGTGSGDWVVVPKGGVTPDPTATAPTGNPPPGNAATAAAPAAAAPSESTAAAKASPESSAPQQPQPPQQQPQQSQQPPAATATPATNKSDNDTPAAASTASMGFDADNDFGSLGDLDTAGDALASFNTDTPGDLGGDFMEDSAFGEAFHGVESAGGSLGGDDADSGTPAADSGI
ncbi:SWI/SNF and RSC complexes subunit ssr4 [Apiospora rasikravindrae]|uniref:SWI/SNF and RSC complexes subunit ssr4 n=1 Tax=Apiospora rasikravindrae TaxID=990691 RepID=A0ABR1U8Q5_9PEZI